MPEISNTVDNTIKIVFLLLSKIKGFDLSELWMNSLRPDKSFFEISREEPDSVLQLERIEEAVGQVSARQKSTLNGGEAVSYSKGKFLIYSPLLSTFDALANGETSGFFDESDAPPWTTWLGFFNFTNVDLNESEGYLVAWIPEAFISIAENGMSVCLGQSLFWADDLKTAETHGANAILICEELSLVKVPA
jgi:hypothetical protein